MESNMSDSSNGFGRDPVVSATMEQLAGAIQYCIKTFDQMDKLQKLTTLNLIMRVAFTGRVDKVILPPRVPVKK